MDSFVAAPRRRDAVGVRARRDVERALPVWFHRTTVVGGHHVVEVQLLEIGDQPEDEHRVTEVACIRLFDGAFGGPDVAVGEPPSAVVGSAVLVDHPGRRPGEPIPVRRGHLALAAAWAAFSCIRSATNAPSPLSETLRR